MASGGSQGNPHLEHLWNQFYIETDHVYQDGEKQNNIYVIAINEKNFADHLYDGSTNQGKSVLSPTVNPYKFCRAIHRNFIKGVVEERPDKFGGLKLKYFVIARFNKNIGWRDFDKNKHFAGQNENSDYAMVLYEKSYFSTKWEVISIQTRNAPFKRRAVTNANTYVITNNQQLPIDTNSVST